MATEIGELRARMTADSQQIKAELRQVKQYLKEQGDEAKAAAGNFDALNNALSQVGLGADQIKKINNEIRNTNPQILEKQLEQVRNQLRMLGVDAKQIDKIEQEMKEATKETKNTKQGIDGLASGLTALGTGAATIKLAGTFKTLATEANNLANSYRGLGVVAKAFNVDTEQSVDLADELADRWGLNKGMLADTIKTYLSLNLSLEETEKIITATADAAVYNKQAHLNWDQAIKQVAEGIKAGNSNLTDAAGITTNLSVMQDRYAKSIGTTAAKLTESQKVQAAYNGMLEEGAIFAGNADSAMTGYTGTQATFNSTLQEARTELGEAFLPVMQELLEMVTPLIKEFSLWASENEDVIAGLAAAAISVGGLITVLTSLIAVVAALRVAFTALNITMGPIGWAIAAFSAVTLGVTAYSTAASAASDDIMQLASSQEELNQKLNAAPYNRKVSELKQLKEDSESLNTVLEERAQLQEKIDELHKKMRSGFDGGPELYNLQYEIGKLDKKLKDMDFKNVDEAKAALKRMNEEIEKSVPALVELERAELAGVAAKVQHIDKVNGLKREYDELNGKEKLSENQKQRLNDVVRDLVKEYPSLIASLDEENRWHITNRESLDDLIKAEKDSVDASAQASKDRYSNWRTETEAKLKLAKLQIGALEKIEKFNFAESTVGKSLPGELGKGIETIGDMVITGIRNKAQSNANAFQQEINDIDKDIQSITTGAFDRFMTSKGADFTTDEKKKKTKTGKTAAELARERRKEAYDAAIATVQYQAEMYDWTAEKQIEAYEKIQKQHKQHLKETIEDERQMNLQLKRLQEDTVKSRYDFSAEWIGREDRRMEESGRSEIEIAQMKIDAWTRVRDRYSKDSEYYKDADEKLYQARKTLISELDKAMNDLYSSTSDFLKQEERKLEENGASETEIAQMKLELWTRIRDSYAKDSEYYKQGDEQVYQAKKNLISQIQNDNEAARKVEKQSITNAKKLELESIAERRKAYTDAIDERIAAIDRLIKAEDRLNAEQDYESLLAEKKARQATLADAVSPEGRKEYADITAEIERMELEHSRDIRKQNLEDQKEALQDEKSERERAFDKEKSDAEAHYDALTDVLENYQDDVKLMETGLQDFRVEANQMANVQILSDLDNFVSTYNSKLASITIASGPSQQASDLQEYNSNKDAWEKAKASGNTTEMARLTQRNDAIRKQYGIEKDTGRLDQLPSYDVGGRVKAPLGVPVPAIVHGGEAIFNPQQLDNLFRMLDVPRTLPVLDRSESKGQTVITNHFDMSVGSVTIEDQTDASIIYTQRERSARRLATTGGGK